ncbi:MAG: hypothetical protein GXP27_21070 [Planctomycetes bacterium]|nr:hypothetical protein [Planctomycetota bacterium]
MADSRASSERPRPFLGIHMKCCNVYIRAYRSRTEPAYVGWCPRCGARVHVPIVRDGGSTDRFFSAY